MTGLDEGHRAVSTRSVSATERHTYHVFLPPSLASLQTTKNKRKTKLVKIAGARRSREPNARGASLINQDANNACNQKENAAAVESERSQSSKGKQRALDDQSCPNTSLTGFFPKPLHSAAYHANQGIDFLHKHSNQTSSLSSSSESSSSSSRPSPTPAEQAAHRLVSRRSARPSSSRSPSEPLPSEISSLSELTDDIDDSSPGVPRGVPLGQEYESKLDVPTSWTDTFLDGLAAHEADLTARAIVRNDAGEGEEEEWTGPFSLGSVAIGKALRPSFPEEEGIDGREPRGEAYASGEQAEQSIGRALRAESEAESRPPEEQSGPSIWPMPSAMAAPGRERSNNRVRFVSAKCVMSSTQAGENRPASASRQGAGARLPLPEVISSGASRAPSSSGSETEDEQEVLVASPHRKKRTSYQGYSIASRSAGTTAGSRSVSRSLNTGLPPSRENVHHRQRPSACERCLSPMSEPVSKHPSATTKAAPLPQSSESTSHPSKPVCRFTFMSGQIGASSHGKAAIPDGDDSRGLKRTRSEPVASDADTTKVMRRADSDDVSIATRRRHSAGKDRSRSSKSRTEDQSRASHIKKPFERRDLTGELDRSASRGVMKQKERSAANVSIPEIVDISNRFDRSKDQSWMQFDHDGSAMLNRSERFQIGTPHATGQRDELGQPPRRPPLVPSKLVHSFTAESLERSCESFASDSNQSSVNATGLDSIPPPPTLNFDPHTITPIASIVQDPTRYLSYRNGGPSHQTSAPRINLLALVREVGPLEEVGTKVYSKGRVVEGAVNMTLRSELVLMDSGGSLLKVCIWGECAEHWAGLRETVDSDDEDEGDAEGAMATQQSQDISRPGDVTSFSALLRPGAVSKRERATKECPALQPGDVISLESIIISLRRTAAAGDVSVSHIRGGDSDDTHQIQVQGSASSRTNSRAELCWRWNTRNGSERRKYSFDPVLSTFDRRCKEVWRCAQRWEV